MSAVWVVLLLAGPMDKPALTLPTLGGLQFWSDVYLFGTWRIQQAAESQTYRLLDGDNQLHASGTENACLDAFATLRQEKGLKPEAKPTVLLLPGIARTRYCMSGLARHLQRAGFATYQVSYASTRLPIDQHGENLQRIISRLEGAARIHLVGHSMGGLVIRDYLTRPRDPRLGRVVMLGTPNHGAEKADYWQSVWLFRTVLGPAGQQLVSSAKGKARQLPQTLPLEFGILAGGKGNETGYSRWLPGDDDGTVTLASARLDGARDFRLVYCRHTFLMELPQVHYYTATFLQHGFFTTDSQRQPIAAEKPDAKAAP